MIRKDCQFYERLPLKQHGRLLSTMVNKYIPSAIGIFVAFLLAASPAQAVQAHGGVEGLVSHQIGHILFAVGMGYLLYRLYAMHLRGTGWLEFKTFLWLLLVWNVMTFTGHWMNEFVVREQFVKANGNTLLFTIENFPDALYYLSRLDHLVLIPSFVFLLLALRKWRA